MTEPTIDVPLLRKVLEHVTAHRELHVQRFWLVDLAGARTSHDWNQVLEEEGKATCGTAGCLAGWTTLLAGYEPDVTLRRGFLQDYVERDGRIEFVEAVARRELGLTLNQTTELFSPNNSLRDLWRLASEFTNGDVAVPPAVESGEVI